MKPSISIDNNKNIRESRNTDTEKQGVYSSKLLTFSERDLEIASDTIAFRIPIKYKIMYKKLGFMEKKRLREALLGLIEAFYNKEQGSINNMVINININEVKAESKPEINVNIDLGEIVRLVEKLYRYRDTMYPLQRKLVEQLYKKIEKVIMN